MKWKLTRELVAKQGQQREGREERTSFSRTRFQVEPRAAFIGRTGGQHVCCLIAPVQCKLVVWSCFTSLAPFFGLSMDSKQFHSRLPPCISKEKISSQGQSHINLKKKKNIATFDSFYFICPHLCYIGQRETRLALKDRDQAWFDRGRNKIASKMHQTRTSYQQPAERFRGAST